MKALNILIVTRSNSSISSLRPEAEMFINFVKLGHKVTIVTQKDTDYGRRYQEEGLTVVDFAPQKKICFKTIKIIRNLLRTEHFDIVFATNSKSIPNAAFACIGFPVKMITYRGTTGGLYRHDPTAYLTHLHPRVDGIVCVSDAVKEDVQKQVWKNKDKVVTVHKGHDLAWYDKQPADLTEFGISNKDFVVICAVNARPSKGIPVLLDAIEQVADIQHLHLLLVGKNMEQYQPIIDRSAMKNRIHKLGYRNDAPELMVASNVLVQPSISGEGLPRAVMEALSYGVAPIITTTGGGKEVIENGVNGFIVATHDANAIAAHIRTLAKNPEILNEMSLACKKTISDKFSCVNSSQRYIEYFNTLLTS